MRKIGIIGGSFDPIHTGHTQLALKAIEFLGLDEIYFLPTANHPWKNIRANAKDRLTMIKLAIDTIKHETSAKIGILDTEITAKENRINYTFDTTSKIKSKFNKSKLYFIFGADQLADLSKWKNIDMLKDMIQLVAFYRPGWEMDLKICKEYNIISFPLAIDISSTSIRNNFSALNLQPNVYKYILDHQIYLEERIKSHLSEERFNHTLRVKDIALKYASKMGLSQSYLQKIYIAAMLHDIAKEIDDKKSKSMIKTHFPEFLNSPAFHHQLLGSYIAEEEFKVKNKMILNAIARHTTGNNNMSMLDKIIYAADKTSSDREAVFVALQKKLEKDFDRGFAELMKLLYRHYHDKDDPVSIKMYLKYGQKEKN